MGGTAARIADWARAAFCLGLVLALVGCARPLLRTDPADGMAAATYAAPAPAVHLQQRAWRSDAIPSAPRTPAYEFLRTGLREASAKPPAAPKRVLVLPIEFEGDNGAANGNANLIRLLPAYEGPHGSGWRIQHLDILTLANAPGGLTGAAGNPEPIQGPRATGLSDWVHVSFFVPDSTEHIHWGLGAALGVPTATDDVLGSGKWSAGPAFRFTWRNEPWNLGIVAAQRWSFAGDASRADTDQLMMRGAFRRQLGEHWYLVSAPIITANWNAASGERWLVPLGGGIGRKFDLWGRPWSASVQAYANVIRPTGAPTWAIRLSLAAIIPLER